MMRICSIGNQICVAQDLKLYACCVCAYFSGYKCVCMYIFAKFTNKYELESPHTLGFGFFLYFLDFIREYRLTRSKSSHSWHVWSASVLLIFFLFFHFLFNMWLLDPLLNYIKIFSPFKKKTNQNQTTQPQNTKKLQGKKGEEFHLLMGMQQWQVVSQLKYYR